MKSLYPCYMLGMLAKWICHKRMILLIWSYAPRFRNMAKISFISIFNEFLWNHRQGYILVGMRKIVGVRQLIAEFGYPCGTPGANLISNADYMTTIVDICWHNMPHQGQPSSWVACKGFVQYNYRFFLNQLADKICTQYTTDFFVDVNIFWWISPMVWIQRGCKPRKVIALSGFTPPFKSNQWTNPPKDIHIHEKTVVYYKYPTTLSNDRCIIHWTQVHVHANATMDVSKTSLT